MFLLGWSFSGAQESVGTEQMPRDGDRSELEPESDGGTRIKDVLEWNPREFWGISSRTGKGQRYHPYGVLWSCPSLCQRTV